MICIRKPNILCILSMYNAQQMSTLLHSITTFTCTIHKSMFAMYGQCINTMFISKFMFLPSKYYIKLTNTKKEPIIETCVRQETLFQTITVNMKGHMLRLIELYRQSSFWMAHLRLITVSGSSMLHSWINTKQGNVLIVSIITFRQTFLDAKRL